MAPFFYGIGVVPLGSLFKWLNLSYMFYSIYIPRALPMSIWGKVDASGWGKIVVFTRQYVMVVVTIAFGVCSSTVGTAIRVRISVAPSGAATGHWQVVSPFSRKKVW